MGNDLNMPTTAPVRKTLPAANVPSANAPAANSPAANTPAANAPAANTPAANTPAANAPATDAQVATTSDTQAASTAEKPNHVMGFFEGFVREGLETAVGLYTLVTTNPLTTAKGLTYIVVHPINSAQAIVRPYTTAYKDGKYGELAGRVGFQVLTVVITSGALSKKGAQVGKVAAPTAEVTKQATRVASDLAKKIGAKRAVAELAGSSLKGAAYTSKLAAETAKQTARVTEQLARRGIADKIAAGIAASGATDAEVMNVVAAAGKKAAASDVFRYASAATKAGMKPAEIASQLATKAVQTNLRVAAQLLATQSRNLALIGTAGSTRTAAAIADQMNKYTALIRQSTDPALKAGYTAQLDALKTAVAANPRTANLVEKLLKGQAIGRFEQMGAGMGSAIDGVGGAANKVYKGGQALKTVLDGPKTIGGYVSAVGSVPAVLGRGMDKAVAGTLGALRNGLKMLPKFEMPTINLQTIAAIRVPSPWELITAPAIVGAWSLKNPVRALGAASLVGSAGKAAKVGLMLPETLKEPPEAADPTKYALKKDDTLESIAEKLLGDKKYWTKIEKVNKELLESFERDGGLAVGTMLTIPTAAQLAEPDDAPETTPGAKPSDYSPAVDTPAVAPAANEPPGTLKEYEVKRNDSLESIAKNELGDATRSKDLATLNQDRYPSLAANPDFLGIGWKLQLPATAPTTPAAKVPAANAPAANVPVATPAPTGKDREDITKRHNLAKDDANFNEFWKEIGTYATTTVGPETGTDADRKGLQTLLQKLGYPVEVTGNYYELGADKKPKKNAQGEPISPTAEAVVDFKRVAGITQNYKVIDPAGKPTPEVNEYVDTRTRETMAVALGLLQDKGVRKLENMEGAVREAARLQESAIGPDLQGNDARVIVQQYLNGLGYTVPMDGKFGDATVAALVEFKRKKGLAAGYKDDAGKPVFTPYVDRATADALYAAIEALAPKK